MQNPPSAGIARCAACDTDTSKPQHCSRCKETYCNAVCQKKDWAHHKHGCANVRFVTSPGLGRFCMTTKELPAGTLLHVEAPEAVVRSQRDMTDAMRPYFPPSKSWESLASAFFSARWTDDDITENYALAPESDKHQTVVARAVAANSTPMVSLLTNQRYGTAWYSKFRFVNHGCMPNAAYVIGTGARLYLFSTRDMIKGEEVRIGYMPMRRLLCTCLRKELIQTHFGFECECMCCTHSTCTPDDSARNGGHSNFDPLHGYPANITAAGMPTLVHETYSDIDVSDAVMKYIHGDEALLEVHYMMTKCIRTFEDDDERARAAIDVEKAAHHATEHYSGPCVPEVLHLAAWHLRNDGTPCSAHTVMAVMQSLRSRYKWHKTPLEFSPLPPFITLKIANKCFNSLDVYETIDESIRGGKELADAVVAENGKDEVPDGSAAAAATAAAAADTPADDQPLVREWFPPLPEEHDIGDADDNSNTFTVMQFNMLADSLHDAFPNVPDQSVLKWESRGPRLLDEIEQIDPDILCAEEVDEDHYENYILPALKRKGYIGEFVKRVGTERTHGVCIFWRLSTFRLHHSYFANIGDGHVGLVVGLRHAKNNKVVVVSTAHFKAKPGFENRRLREGVLIIAAACEVAELMYGGDKDDLAHFVMCGDFNDEPNSPVYKYFATGEANHRHDVDKGTDACSDVAMLPHELRHLRYSCPVTHTLGLTSAYSRYALRGDDDGNCPGTHEPYTTYKKRDHEVIHCIDYIWVPSAPEGNATRYGGQLHIRALLEIPPRTALPHRLPSATYPSDHFAIAAQLSFP